jgi:RNA polymerase sigma factor (sigma-70 family)
MDEYVRAAQRGDPAAMSVVLDHLAHRLGRVCGSIALDRGDDALQETLIVVLRNLGTLREPAALYSWARRIAVREALRLVTGSRDVAVSEFNELAATDVDVSLGVDVRAVLATLTPTHRAVLVLRHVEDLTEEQVADVMDVTVGTVKSRASRAKEAFVARWNQ